MPIISSVHPFEWDLVPRFFLEEGRGGDLNLGLFAEKETPLIATPRQLPADYIPFSVSKFLV